MRGIVEAVRRVMGSAPTTHRSHLDMCRPLDKKGLKVRFTGWNMNCGKWQVGDYVVYTLRDGKETRYEILEFEQCADPRDMYFMTGKFAPRRTKNLTTKQGE